LASWSPTLRGSAQVVEVCTATGCDRHGETPGDLAVLRDPDDLGLVAGPLSVACCFDREVGGSPQECARVLRAVRAALADHGVAVFTAADQVEPCLAGAGFGEWERTDVSDPALAGPAGGASVLVARAVRRRPAARPELLNHADLLRLVKRSRSPSLDTPGTTMVVPIRNEARNLFPFCTFLERMTNTLGSRREIVLVVNGSNDDSERIAREWAEGTTLDARVLTSEPGIVPAFRTGAADSRFGGFIGKLDADVIVHPFLLDSLELHLLSAQRLSVTHAEPLPADSFSHFSEPDHRPEAASPRLYFNGKASLYRSNPFHWPDVAELPLTPRAEDVFFSFYLAYLEGPASIGRAPGGYVFQKTIRTFEDLVGMLSRTRSEIRRHTSVCPGFAPLSLLFDQQVFSAGYRQLLAEAAPHVRDVDHWVRLESTK
jgi:Glycosyl transferase family 2